QIPKRVQYQKTLVLFVLLPFHAETVMPDPPLRFLLPFTKPNDPISSKTRRQTRSQRKLCCKPENLAQLPYRTHTLAASVSNPHVSFSPFRGSTVFLIPSTVASKRNG
ncbi:hypothetical protein AABB24_001073, partial [Solanum stoloniferum]